MTEPKGRIVRRWESADRLRQWTLRFACGYIAAGVSDTYVMAWVGDPRDNACSIRAGRNGLSLDDAKALAEQWLTEAGYEIVDPPRDEEATR